MANFISVVRQTFKTWVRYVTFLAERRLCRCWQPLGPGTGSGDALPSTLPTEAAEGEGSRISRFSVMRMIVLPLLIIRLFSLQPTVQLHPSYFYDFSAFLGRNRKVPLHTVVSTKNGTIAINTYNFPTWYLFCMIS